MPAVIHDQGAVIVHSAHDGRIQAQGAAVISQVFLEGPVHPLGKPSGRIVVHHLKQSFILLRHIVGREKHVFLPCLAVRRALIRDNLPCHRIGLSHGGRGQPSDVHAGGPVITADFDKPVVRGRFPHVLGECEVSRDVFRTFHALSVVLRVRGPVPDQQHVSRCRRSPVFVGIGKHVLDSHGAYDPITELIAGMFNIHDLDAEPLSLSQRHKVDEPGISKAAFVPPQIPVGDQDPIRCVGSGGKSCGPYF